MEQEANIWSSSLQGLNRAYALKSRRCQVVEYNTDVLQTEEPTPGRATRGVHDSVGVVLGKSKMIFSLILVLVIRFRLIILDEEGTEEISDSLGDFTFASITDEGIHGSPFSDVSREGVDELFG